jgi:MraZ protein
MKWRVNPLIPLKKRRRARRLPVKRVLAQMFLGQYQHSLDTKGRLIVPARFRDDLAEGGFVTRGFDRCLMVMTLDYFEAVYQRINAMNLADPATRELRRLFFANAYSITPDKVGRINLPPDLRQFAQIETDTTVAGQGEYFEIWTPSLWQEQVNSLENAEANAQRFTALDLSKD